MTPDWLPSTLNALPYFLWMFAGLGLPWALVSLPRRDWSRWPMVLCLALALGPALLTAWMFVLGTLGMNSLPLAAGDLNPMQTSLPGLVGGHKTLTRENILLGTLVIALIGVVLGGLRLFQWPARGQRSASVRAASRLAFDERALLALILVAVMTRAVTTWFTAFGEWDELWVYGYQGRIYTLIGFIPRDIGYYPQFLPLQYAYGQIMTGGINDHAARAGLPLLHLGSVLAAYLLGALTINRRAGIFAAALWALYPDFGYWTRVGDLEIPTTFTFTASAAFFLAAWKTATGDPAARAQSRRYALIAGVCFGIAMWTKPTAGAFVWGVVLIVGAALAQVVFQHWSGGRRGMLAALRTAWLPRFYVAALTGLACLPLGAVWYIRNLALGHEAVVFPQAIWLTRAMRSGAEFGWPLLALATLVVVLAAARQIIFKRRLALGLGLLLAGVLPSILDPHRMQAWEWAAFAGGVGLAAWALWRSAARHLTPTSRRDLGIVTWASLLALPYFVTWFYSYSYHYRLSFIIVPLMILPTATLLARWLTPERLRGWRPGLRGGVLLVMIAAALPGLLIFNYDYALRWNWLAKVPTAPWSALTGSAWTLDVWAKANPDTAPVIFAPGHQRLPFIYPTWDIRITGTPRSLAELEGVTHVIDSLEAREIYVQSGEATPFQNQLWGSLGRQNVATLLTHYGDSAFLYDTYVFHPERRFDPPLVEMRPAGDVQIGSFARYAGHTVDGHVLRADGDVVLEIAWVGVAPAPADYSVFVHLMSAETGEFVGIGWDGPVARWALSYYATLFWEKDETILDRRVLRLPAGRDLPPGEYQIRVGFYDPVSGERVPFLLDGAPAGDGWLLETLFRVEAAG